jgi:hypothetical protein
MATAVDHLARVIASLPERDDPPGTGYWVLAKAVSELGVLLRQRNVVEGE